MGIGIEIEIEIEIEMRESFLNCQPLLSSLAPCGTAKA